MIEDRRRKFNRAAIDADPFYLVVFTATVTTVFWYVQHKLREWFRPDINETHWFRIKRMFTKIILSIPIISTIPKKKISDFTKTINTQLMDIYKKQPFYIKLPEKGKSSDEIMKDVDRYLSLSEFKWDEGRVSGAVYCNVNDKEFIDLMTKIYAKTAYTNPLHADVYPGIRKMEAEIVRITCSLYKGNSQTCGVVSTGGTESIVLVVKAYRDYARNERGITKPEIIVPITAHPAFDKAAELLRVKINKIKINPKTMKADVKSMKSTINSNTCLLVASAPAYPHGIYDPIEEIAKLGLKYDVPVHVDACLGGFLNPFVEKAGFTLTHKGDFTLPGVTSITADTHKYGYAPKGTSVVMYKHPKYRQHQYFITTDWPGGLYSSPTIPGSRPGALIADCWASLVYHGEEKFVENTRKILQVCRSFIKQVEEIEGVYILGKPELSVVAISSDDFNIFMLSDRLTHRGWSLNALQFPSAFHICFTLMHTLDGVLDKLVMDIKEIAAKLYADRANYKKLDGQAALYGMSQSIPDRSLINSLSKQYLDSYYNTFYDENN